ncbi:hypothetical protein HDU97_001564 [Phlyctochytrium planicorne]|nr:hypothetical protein HDU97_001564 [Phlyctochytrium planicorne]
MSSIEQVIQRELVRAQQCIAKQEYEGAADAFTKLIDTGRIPNPAVILLSRSTCYMQLKKYDRAIEDAEVAFKCPDVQTGEELMPGCYTTRTAAAARLASAYKAVGDNEKAETFKKMATELMKKSAGSVNEAMDLKEEGNVLFKEGKVVDALRKWQAGLQKDAVNTGILSNCSLAFLKLGQFEPALDMAERCIKADPQWAKGWFRKGAVLMKLNRYLEAMAAFQGGLRCTPDDADLKKCYMEASKAAESTKRKQAGVDKRMMGMLMDLRYKSFDVKQFMSKTKIRSQLEYWSLKIEPMLSTVQFEEFLEKTMKLVFPNFRKGMKPVSENPFLSSQTWTHYVLPSHPLLTALIFLRLLSSMTPKSAWHIIWTHSIPSAPFVKSSLYPHMTNHMTYAALVAKDTGEVVDILSLWAREVGGDQKDDGTRWLDRITTMIGKEVKDKDKDKEKEKEENVDERLDQAVWYTCDDEKKVYEYLEYYYENLAEASQPASATSAKPPVKPKSPTLAETTDDESIPSASEIKDSGKPATDTPVKKDKGGFKLLQDAGILVAVLASLGMYAIFSGLVSTSDLRTWFLYLSDAVNGGDSKAEL